MTQANAAVEIQFVRTDAQALHVETLAWGFIDWLRDRYPDMQAEIDRYLTHQKFAEQIADIRSYYGPPKGDCLLAVLAGAPVGIVMMKDVGAGVCEMNRMFVLESARGAGAGRALVKTIQNRARELGFTRMTLGALPRHHEALALYRKMGFTDDPRTGNEGNTNVSLLMAMDL